MPLQTPATELPPVGANDEQAHARISRRFREHTAIEIKKENRLQASEKIWASVAHALKAVAEQRGWENDSHTHLYDVARQLGTESSESTSRSRRSRSRKATAFVKHLDVAGRMHDNFYENERSWADIFDARDDAQKFIDQLNIFLDKPPGRFRIRTPEDQYRLARLLGLDENFSDMTEAQRKAYLDRVLPRGTTSPEGEGFSPNFGYTIPDSPEDDDDGGGSGVPVDRSPQGDPPSPGDLHRRERETTIPAEPRGWKSRRPRSQEPKAPAAVAAQSSKPSRERRRVIAPRPSARR